MLNKSKSMVVITFVLSLLLSSQGGAVPGLINYQGRLTDSNGAPLNGFYDMIFYIYDVASEGGSLWGEGHVVEVTNVYTVFNLVLRVHLLPPK